MAQVGAVRSRATRHQNVIGLRSEASLSTSDNAGRGEYCSDFVIPMPSLDDMRSMIERTLAWYGLRSVRLGSLDRRSDGAMFADLTDPDGNPLDRVEVDRMTGVLRPTGAQASRLVGRSSPTASRIPWWAEVSAA